MGQQKPQEKPNKPKKTKKTILNGLTQDSSHRIVFFVFFCFPRVFGQLGLGQQKPQEQPNKPKKTKKTILNGLTQDSSHRIVFFVFCWFSSSFWTFGKLGMEKREKNKTCKNPTLPASVSVFKIPSPLDIPTEKVPKKTTKTTRRYQKDVKGFPS